MAKKNLFGLTGGVLMAAFHLLWLILVGLKLAKPLMDKILSLHHIQLTYSMIDFRWGHALVLIIFTFIVGYVGGWALAAVCNLLKEKKI